VLTTVVLADQWETLAVMVGQNQTLVMVVAANKAEVVAELPHKIGLFGFLVVAVVVELLHPQAKLLLVKMVDTVDLAVRLVKIPLAVKEVLALPVVLVVVVLERLVVV
tara:strand:- start:216 stop:539 length:324 start_codon:yes stop_codon:yes gene_type:complete